MFLGLSARVRARILYALAYCLALFVTLIFTRLINAIRLLSGLIEMIHMILYKEEVLGALWPEKVNTRGPRAVT